MRIIDKLTDYIESHAEVTITDVDSFYQEDSERVMLRQDPNTAVETRYYDKSRVGAFAYDIFSKSMNAETAVANLFKIEDILDLPSGLALDSGFEVVKNEILQSAHFVSKTDKHEKIYVSSFMLDYYMEG